MPHCENTKCNKNIAPEEVRQDKEGKVVCSECAKVTPLHTEPREGQVLNREFDYAFGYTKKNGIQAHVRLGGAKLSFEVSQEELTRTFGPEAP